MLVVKFVLALVIGSTLAALITVVWTSPESVAPLVVFGTAATFALFGLLPAAVLGMASLTVFRRLNVTHLRAVLLQTGGGAAVGAVFMTVTFTGFERWGAIAGSSIGLMQGWLLYGHSIRDTDTVAPPQ